MLASHTPKNFKLEDLTLKDRLAVKNMISMDHNDSDEEEELPMRKTKRKWRCTSKELQVIMSIDSSTQREDRYANRVRVGLKEVN
mmetsp:Transcript_40273/g.29014  ORF Transcript_40273/g.29014 Transcript_40273/m.29014 type:complete len:85 (-) Transcript_40273:65-319(-)